MIDVREALLVKRILCFDVSIFYVREATIVILSMPHMLFRQYT